jgi:hypothetical protein
VQAEFKVLMVQQEHLVLEQQELAEFKELLELADRLAILELLEPQHYRSFKVQAISKL